MAKIISIFILKGGTGKTFLTFTLGGFFAAPKSKLGLNKRVLLIDCDPQGSLTKKFILNSSEFGPTLNHFLDSSLNIPFEKCIHNIEKLKFNLEKQKAAYYKNLDILPIRPNSLRFFLNLDKTLIFRLNEELKRIQSQYDYIFIDCSNQMEPAFYMALLASDYVIIPTTCDVEGLECYFNTKSTISALAQKRNPKLKVMGVVGNLYHSVRGREKFFVQQKLPGMITEEGNDYFFKIVIQNLASYKKSLDNRTPINILETPSSKANKLFNELVQEIANYPHNDICNTQ